MPTPDYEPYVAARHRAPVRSQEREYVPYIHPNERAGASAEGQDEVSRALRDAPIPSIPGYVIPPASFVTDPTSTAVRMAAVRQRMNLLQALGAARDGKLPTNEQLEDILGNLMSVRSLERHRHLLSPDGAKVLSSLERLGEHLRCSVIPEKNPNEELQSFLYHARQAAMKTSVQATIRTDLPPTITDPKRFLKNTFTVGRLILTHPHFRDILLELNDVTQDILSEVTQKGADYVRKSRPLSLRRSAQSGDESTATTATTPQTHRDARPALSISIPGEQGTTNMSMMDTPGPTTSASMTPTTAGIHVPGQYLNAQRTGSQFSSTVPSSDQIPVADKHVPEHYGTPILRSRASTASAGVDLATPSGARFPSVRINPNPEIEQEREARLGRTETATTTQTFVGDQSIGADLSAAQDIKDAVMSGLGRPMTKREGKRPETDQAARVEQCEPIGLSSGMAALQEVGGVIQEKLSDMERIRTIGEHFRHIMRELQGHPEYQDTLEYFAELMADLQALTTQAETARRFGRGGRELSEHLNIMGEELKSLMSNFAGGKPLDPFLNTVAALKEHVQDDHHTRALIRDVQVFLRKSLRSHRFLSQDTYLDQATDLLERIRVMMFEETGLAEAVTSSAPQVAEATGVRPPANRGRYRQDVQRVARELNVLLGAFGQDRTTMELMERLRKLGSSMFLDRTGKSIQLKPSLFSDFTSVVIPVLIDQIKYVPIPRIEHSDSDYHFIVENVILTSKNFLPNLVEVKVKNAAVVGLQEIMPSRMQHQLTMNFFQIHADIHDIPFYYKKKSGFLRISDYGVASIMISGQGISVLTKVLVDPNDPNRTLIPRNVEAHIDNLALDIQHSQYDNLYTAMAPLLNSVIKFQIKTAIQDEILNLLSRIDAPITQYKRDLYVYGTGLREPTMGLLQTSWNRMLSSVGLGGAPAKVTGMDSKTRRMRRLERRRREREEANYQRDVRKRMEEARRRRGSGQMDRELEEEEERVGRSAFARPAEKEAAVHPADRFLDDTKPAWMSDAFSMHALKH